MCTGTHPFIPVEDVARLELIYTVNGERCENVGFLHNPAGWTTADMLETLIQAVDQWADTIAIGVSSDVQLVLLKLTDLSAEEAAGVEYVPEAATLGQVESPALPNNVTLATKFSTGLTGRSNRGRHYLVGIPTNEVDGNQVVSGYADGIAAKWRDFYSAFESLPVPSTHVVVSFCHDNAWREVGDFHQVLTYSTEGNIDSQRRRLAGRGD